MEDFTQVSHVNVTGVFYTVLAFLPLLQAANEKRPAPVPGTLSPPSPQVIVTSSIAGFSRIAPFGFAYSLSKAGVNHPIKVLASLLIPIRHPRQRHRAGYVSHRNGSADVRVAWRRGEGHLRWFDA